jgi:hypothetical protein
MASMHRSACGVRSFQREYRQPPAPTRNTAWPTSDQHDHRNHRRILHDVKRRQGDRLDGELAGLQP